MLDQEFSDKREENMEPAEAGMAPAEDGQVTQA